MATTKLTQVCAYANWPDESFEIWRLYPVNKSHREISKEMRSLFLWIFSHISSKGIEELEHASFTIGGTDEEMEVDSSKARNAVKRIYFGWYRGSCLDKDRLQYFKPDGIIKHGIVEIIGNNQADFYEIPKLGWGKESHKLNLSLLLRRMLGDDPKRVEVDRMRSKLGLQADFLFNWKEEYQMKKRTGRDVRRRGRKRTQHAIRKD